MPLAAVDTHVHLHRDLDPGRMLSMAHRNATHAAERRPDAIICMLADLPGQDSIERLQRTHSMLPRSISPKLERFTDQGVPCLLLQADDAALLVIQGYQLQTHDRMEVLALASPSRPEDHQDLRSAVDAARDVGAEVVLPWGVGKWTGARGRTLCSMIEAWGATSPFSLSDSAHRPWWWPTPSALALAEERGIPVLNGSDPLSVRGDEERIASAGVLLETPSWPPPLKDLRAGLHDHPQRYGRRMGTYRFSTLQATLRLRPG
jgi:hypothetical protein